jgi:hypothetical protein
MQNTHLHTNVNVIDVDASGLFQPNGPTKTDAPVFSKPGEHRDIQNIRNETLIALAQLQEDLKATRDDLIAFTVIMSPEVHEARRAWYRSKPERTGRAGVYEKWEKADPELQDLESVRAAKRKVAEIQAQLTEAQAELDRLEVEGTPRGKYMCACS